MWRLTMTVRLKLGSLLTKLPLISLESRAYAHICTHTYMYASVRILLSKNGTMILWNFGCRFKHVLSNHLIATIHNFWSSVWVACGHLAKLPAFLPSRLWSLLISFTVFYDWSGFLCPSGSPYWYNDYTMIIQCISHWHHRMLGLADRLESFACLDSSHVRAKPVQRPLEPIKWRNRRNRRNRSMEFEAWLNFGWISLELS